MVVPECRRCGTCCTAPDITSLGKRVGDRCVHLEENGLCGIYEQRPQVCQNYQPDELCNLIAAPTLAGRVEKYLSLFGLSA
jgi:hypothetical protein